jgi:hypothetical protein
MIRQKNVRSAVGRRSQEFYKEVAVSAAAVAAQA